MIPCFSLRGVVSCINVSTSFYENWCMSTAPSTTMNGGQRYAKCIHSFSHFYDRNA